MCFRTCRTQYVKLYNNSRTGHSPVRKLCGFEENLEIVLEAGRSEHSLIEFR